MHKFITFKKAKEYLRCLDLLTNDDGFKQKATHYSFVNTFLVREEDLESLSKLLGKRKFHVSQEVTVKLHADQIPWGVEKIGAPKFWERTKGRGVKVAVIDTGISTSHPDLKGQVKGRVTILNKGRGYERISGHGTHVAGTIAAVANDKGIVGVAPEVELYDIRTFGPDGTAKMSDIVAAINWAIEHKMHVINMSFGTSESHPALESAIKRAAKAGIVMVASAGNNGGAVEYPAAYKEVIAVGAVDQNDKLADFSSRGRGLNTRAPGVKIKSTWLKKSYRELDGTSMAAAHVSGLQALMIASKKAKK